MNLYNKINWEYLSSNPNAIELFKENKDKIDWDNLSDNPNAIKLLKERIEYENSLTNEEFDQLEDKLCWTSLSRNSNAIDLLKENQDKINWRSISYNPSIFEDEPIPII